MNSIDIDVYSHHLTVTGFSPRGKEALLSFCRTMGQVGKVKVNQQLLWKIVKVFVGVHADRSVFRFHVNQLEVIKEHFHRFGYLDSQFNVRFHKPEVGVDVELKMLPKWVAREHQIPIIDYCVADGSSKTVTLQTGKGKTFLSLASAEQIGKRTALTMKGGYIKKWCGDIKSIYGYGPKEIMVIQGSKDLKTAIALGLEGKIDSKFIFFSNKTMHSFLKHYESTNGDTSLYGCAPQDLYRILGIGLIIRDEVHQDFHLNFRLDLYTHVNKTINLSATLHSGSPFLNKMYLVMFPTETRFKGSIYTKYIGVTGLSYRVADPRKVKSMSFGFKSYSHVIFEESLMRNGKLLQDYLAMIFKIVDHKFLQERKPGQKMIIFFAKVEMCSIAMDYIQKRVPALTVKRKTMDDPYENVLTADILVSTLMSAGTALDIPGLLRVLMTVSIDSPQANEQAMGRLREMTGEWAGTLVEFLYLFCLSVPKQVDYHYNKIELLKDKAKFHNERALNITIG